MSAHKKQWWKEWNWYGSFANRTPKSWEKWCREEFINCGHDAGGGASQEEEESRVHELIPDLWTRFVNKVFSEKELLLYAQRSWILKWFPDFDPSGPGQLDTINQPWDYDHIMPSAYIFGPHNIPQVIKDWGGKIGNLRAWPMELNREDQDEIPSGKFVDAPNRREFKIYEMSTAEEQLQASLICAKRDWPDWQSATPHDIKSLPRTYLRHTASELYENEECAKALLRAITTRALRIYRAWYDTLDIGSLYEEGTSEGTTSG